MNKKELELKKIIESIKNEYNFDLTISENHKIYNEKRNRKDKLHRLVYHQYARKIIAEERFGISDIPIPRTLIIYLSIENSYDFNLSILDNYNKYNKKREETQRIPRHIYYLGAELLIQKRNESME